MSAGFTPGPWQYHLRGMRVYGGKWGSAVVANIPTQPNCKADARLIAAAPELYEALEAVMPSPSGLPDELIDPKWAAAKAALAKARGEQ